MKKKLLPVGYFYFDDIPCSRFGIIGKVQHKITIVGYINYNGHPQEIFEVEEAVEINTECKDVVVYDPEFQNKRLC